MLKRMFSFLCKFIIILKNKYFGDIKQRSVRKHAIAALSQ